MNSPIRGLMVWSLLLLAGCATSADRIASNQAMFDSWPAEVREKVRAGQAAVGFTPDMVLVALGQPDRKVLRTSAQGTAEVWTYFDHGPHFSIGVGMGSGGRSSAVGGSVAMTDQAWRDSRVITVTFESGKVSAIESRQ
ncbi:MAG: hypothetical protein JSR48_05750 [Verrucomicrobia bacterium]|nr:hypothetical protein [Verrucomicrobiota bacterium]